ncbi:MAG: MmgE/PrpD family protein [Proteobacteria bacterium]|nr:MmgE/PrpD family protein [Pseudomonadota bacterium]
MTPGETIGRWIADAPRAWSAAASEGARRAFQDTVACMLAGSADEAARRVRAAVAPWGAGSARVVGTDLALAAPWAALANGTAAHALDYDDVLEPAAAHVSAALVPALIALGEERGAPGESLIDAYLVGFEVMARLAEAVNMVHYFRGWHTTLTLGSPAVAAAAARLLRLDGARALAAVSLATSASGGFKRQFGTMAKPVHAGLAAKNGLLAAALAEAGVGAAPDAIEGARGFLELFAGAEPSRLAPALARLGRPGAMEEYGIWLKFYPCCASAHRPVDAILALRARHALTPDAVRKIEATLSEVAAQNLSYARPEDEMQARFSLHYTLAAALLDGRLTLASFTRAAIGRPEVRTLLPRIAMRADPTQPGAGGAGAEHSASVTVALADGRRLSETVAFPRGHPKAPLGDADMAAKFADCAARALDAAPAREALARLHSFVRLADVRELTRHLAANGETPHARERAG